MLAPLRTTLFDLVDLLNREQIGYALVGGLAASLRGQPRVTVDVDVVVGLDVPAASNLLSILDQTAFEPLFKGVEEVLERAFLLPLRHRATGVKVDVAIGLSGFERQLIARAETMTIGDGLVAVATAEDLIIMKVLAARPQDEQDLEGIVVAQGPRIDWDYCLRVAAELGEAVDQDLVGRVRRLRDRFLDGG